MNGERAARVRWSRNEPDVVHVLGSRLRHPGKGPNDPPDFFSGLRAERFATDPLGDPFVFGLAVFTGPDTATIIVRSPLDSDSGRFYQFRSGDTISVQLGDGRAIEAIAVTVIPRFRSIRLVSAMMWIEPESLGLVRVAYRLAKKINSEMTWQLRRGGEWSPGFWIEVGDSALAPDSAAASLSLFDRMANGVFNGIYPRVELDISTVVADYGLWELRYWLPRSVRWAGYMRGDEGITATGIPPPAAPMTIDWTLEIEDILERGAAAAAGTPATAAEALERWRQAGDSIGGEVGSEDPGELVTITPADRRALAVSDLLPPTVWEEETAAVDAAAIDEIGSALAAIGTGEGGETDEAASPWILDPPLTTLRLLRYNPVEGASVGTRLRRDFGWGRGVLTLRTATRRLQAPDVDLTFEHDHPSRRIQASFYRALRGGGVGEGGIGVSPGVFVRGVDPTEFHWSRGAALRILPGGGGRNWLSLSLFAERHAQVETSVERTRFGASAAWRPWWGGFAKGSVGGGGRVGIRGSMGDDPHVKAAVNGALVIPLGDRLSMGLEAGGARVWGDPAAQDLWTLGASGRWLRGHSDAVKTSTIWMGRVDLQQPVRFLRLSFFGDWASTGGANLYAVGTGLVWMDGLMRLDLARGVRWGRGGPLEPGWKLQLGAASFF